MDIPLYLIGLGGNSIIFDDATLWRAEWPVVMAEWPVVDSTQSHYGITITVTLWLFNIAMENGPSIDGLPIKNGDFPRLC